MRTVNSYMSEKDTESDESVMVTVYESTRANERHVPVDEKYNFWDSQSCWPNIASLSVLLVVLYLRRLRAISPLPRTCINSPWSIIVKMSARVW